MEKSSKKTAMDHRIFVDGDYIPLNYSDLHDLDMIPIAKQLFHVIEKSKSYEVKIGSVNMETKTMVVEIGGSLYEISIQDTYDQLMSDMGLTSTSSTKLDHVLAPMPGLILDILIRPGQVISPGDPLLILEAMKMENLLKATGEGIVKSIEVQKGDIIQKGKRLIEME